MYCRSAVKALTRELLECPAPKASKRRWTFFVRSTTSGTVWFKLTIRLVARYWERC